LCLSGDGCSRTGWEEKTTKAPRWEIPIFGSGVICETRALSGAVIPAKAGIYSESHWKCAADGLDSRLRGNDRCFERDPIPNDTTNQFSSRLSNHLLPRD
jgi:hypothetical protein